MKIKVTVNLKNYENIGVESSEFDNQEDCFNQIKNVLERVKTPMTDDFITKYLVCK